MCVTLLGGGNVCYVVRRRGMYVTLLEGGECMLRC